MLEAFGGRRGDQPIEGLTKLAKLDFLLRYPVYLERALVARDAPEAAAQVEDYERNSVEAHMVRFRYGPWDHRYRRFLNILVGKGLAAVRVEGRTITIQLTRSGPRCGRRACPKLGIHRSAPPRHAPQAPPQPFGYGPYGIHLQDVP
jgi:hypothetical protein